MTKKRILVVDDEREFREMLSQFLSSSQYDVLTAASAEEALEIIKHTRPDLILLDMQMPGMGGITFFNQLCPSPTESRYPVIVLTARVNLEELFKDLPVDGFMTKPIHLEDLLHKIQRVLVRKQVMVFPEALQKKGKIMVVDNDKLSFDRIVGELVASGFLVCGTKSGAEALAKAVIEKPDVILAKLGLQDIFGDVLAIELRRIIPESTKIVLYAAYDHNWGSALAKKICATTQISKLVESDKPQDLVREITQLFE